MVQCAAGALGLAPLYLHPGKVTQQPELLHKALGEAAVVFATVGPLANEIRAKADAAGRPDLPVLHSPKFFFMGFHPDVAFPSSAAGERRELPMGNANSAILLAAWRDGLSVKEAVSLFRDEVYDSLGYYDAFAVSRDLLIRECASAGFDVVPLIARWMADGPFVYLPLHPKIGPLNDATMALLDGAGLLAESEKREAPDDDLARNIIWPVYPEIAQRLGIPGDYVFRPKQQKHAPERSQPLDLDSFVERTFACYAEAPPEFASFKRMEDPAFANMRRFLPGTGGSHSSNPYKGLPDWSWWSKAVAETPASEVDPVISTKFAIARHDKVATAGSCFAQHIAKRLAAAGFNYYVAEQAPAGCADPAAEDYGVFSARFGNIYTVRQLVQLVGRAYGTFEPAIDSWELPDGSFVDPFRPRIGTTAFGSLEQLRASRETHLAAVREMVETADVFVFTLGLTEAWHSANDGAVVPLAPGVLKARVPDGAYQPKNFSVGEVIDDLEQIVALLRGKNPKLRIILTVSPVPLIATFENEHVLVATTYSKSVLRAAAGEVADANRRIDYFPSYEIITGSFNRGRYFADDLREVRPEGVDHVMRCFLKHYAGIDAAPRQARPRETDAHKARDWLRAESAAGMNVVCDEEEVETSAGR